MIRVSQSSLDSPIFRFCWRKEAGSRSLESEDEISLKNKISQRIMVHQYREKPTNEKKKEERARSELER